MEFIMKRQYIFLLCLALFCLSACKSSRKTDSSIESQTDNKIILSDVGHSAQVTGLLEQGKNGTFCMTTGAGKSIVSWTFVSSGDAAAVYNQLKDYVGKKVQISGSIIEQRSHWNKTLAVTAVSEAKD